MSRLGEKYSYYAFISYDHRDEREAKGLKLLPLVIFAAAVALCVLRAYAVSPVDVKVEAAVTNGIKALAEKGDAAAQFSLAQFYLNPHHSAVHDQICGT